MELYQINAALASVVERSLEMAEENAGLITEDISQLLDSLQMAKEQKVLELGRVVKNIKAESEMIEVEEKKLRARRKANENYAAWLRTILESQLSGNEKYADANTRISWRRSERTVVHSLEELYKVAPDCVRVTLEPRLTETAKLVKSGSLPAAIATVEEHNNIQIR